MISKQPSYSYIFDNRKEDLHPNIRTFPASIGKESNQDRLSST